MKLCQNNRRSSKNLFIIAAALVLAVTLVSCSGAKATQSVAPAEAGGYASGSLPAASAAPSMAPAPYPEAPNAAQADGLGDQVSVAFSEEGTEDAYQSTTTDRKIIMEGNVSLETFEFDASIQAMDRLIASVGGFAESRTVRGKSSNSRALRSAEYTIRVPKERFDGVMLDMGNIGNVLESNSHGTDITDQYADYQTRVRTLKVQEETLLEIMAKATKLEDVITLESRISEVRYEIEKIENSLKNYDRLVAYSRINIYIQEVDEVTETKPVVKTLGDRVSASFTQSINNLKYGFEDFIVWLAGAWITLIFLGIIVLISVMYIKARKRRKLKAITTEIRTEDTNGEKKDK